VIKRTKYDKKDIMIKIYIQSGGEISQVLGRNAEKEAEE
jgi:hypothetical protein